MVILDENILIDTLKSSYLDLGALEPSPSHVLKAYAVDASGYETYDIYIQPIPLESDQGASLAATSDGIKGCAEVLTDCGGEIEW